jgi:hypothetical protein
MRFDGAIAGVGTASGVRLVVGMWPLSPFGAIVDVMAEHPDGRRVLVAPTREVADFISSTYTFDDVRIEPTALRIERDRWTVTSDTVSVALQVGRRTVVGQLLSLIPRPLARRRWWCVLAGPPARALRDGVRTHGSAGHGRHEYYCALDEHRIGGIEASWDGRDLGALREVSPPVRFGFGSTPSMPSLVRVTTLVDGV